MLLLALVLSGNEIAATFRADDLDPGARTRPHQLVQLHLAPALPDVLAVGLALSVLPLRRNFQAVDHPG